MARLADIAKALELSEATVSNAFTGKGRMKPDTRQAVLEKAAALGYTGPRHPKSSASKNIILVGEGLIGGFSGGMYAGVLQEAASLGLQLPFYSLMINHDPQLRNPSVALLNQRLAQLLVALPTPADGILYLSQYARRIEGLGANLKIPLVAAFCQRESNAPFVHYDDHQGAYLAVSTLLAENRKKIAMISGPIDSIGMYLRSSGYQQALVEHGFAYDPRLVQVGDWDWESGYRLTVQLLKKVPEIDAIFAQNDNIGLGAVRALTEQGLRIPEDVAILGFDDSVTAQLTYPQLTTIRPPFEEMGRTALRRLISLVEQGIDPGDNTLLPCTLVQRASTPPF